LPVRQNQYRDRDGARRNPGCLESLEPQPKRARQITVVFHPGFCTVSRHSVDVTAGSRRRVLRATGRRNPLIVEGSPQGVSLNQTRNRPRREATHHLRDRQSAPRFRIAYSTMNSVVPE
jgi:hypothetical protein